jgi:hypothetical protein
MRRFLDWLFGYEAVFEGDDGRVWTFRTTPGLSLLLWKFRLYARRVWNR